MKEKEQVGSLNLIKVEIPEVTDDQPLPGGAGEGEEKR